MLNINSKFRILIFIGFLLAVALYFYTKHSEPSELELSQNKNINTENTEQVPVKNSFYLGGKNCQACHSQIYSEWDKSYHKLAMLKAERPNVLAPFNGESFKYGKITSKFYQRDGNFYVTTDDKNGELTEFKIDYTFGYFPLQQYLIGFPDGRYQALSIAWDSRPKEQGGQRWFHLYAHDKVDHKDELHWTGLNQNWNYMCAECHSTDLKRNYDSQKDTYNTTWTDIDVTCEACHGPGSNHVEWAQSDPAKKNEYQNSGFDFIMHEKKYAERLEALNKNRVLEKESAHNMELETCARCHSRRGQIAEGPINNSLLNTHQLQLLSQPQYHVDGQIKEEVYEHGSFLQSKMYHQGVSCSDCHNPHSLELRAPGKQVCSSCHDSVKYDQTSHHLHKQNSAGSNCISCHMPEETYMGVDQRADHSIRIPRPDLSEELGVPNACNKCHTDKSPKWAANFLKDKLGKTPTGFQGFAHALDSIQNLKADAWKLVAWLSQEKTQADIARATAISFITQFPTPANLETLNLALKDQNPIVRHSALQALEAYELSYRSAAYDLLKDPILAVRAMAGKILASELKTLTGSKREILQSAINDYIATQTNNLERPEENCNLGNLYLILGDFEKAQSYFRSAIKIQNIYVPAHINLADSLRLQNLESQAEEVLRAALDIIPENAQLLHALALSLVRQNKPVAGTEYLKRAYQVDTNNLNIAYTYAVALNSNGNSKQAIKILESLNKKYPADLQTLYALVAIHRDLGNIKESEEFFQKISLLN